jgi:propanol-preferring alcohol dehydrogenase
MELSKPKLPALMKDQFLDSFNMPYALRSTPVSTPTSPNDLLMKVDAAS